METRKSPVHDSTTVEHFPTSLLNDGLIWPKNLTNLCFTVQPLQQMHSADVDREWTSPQR